MSYDLHTKAVQECDRLYALACRTLAEADWQRYVEQAKVTAELLRMPLVLAPKPEGMRAA